MDRLIEWVEAYGLMPLPNDPRQRQEKLRRLVSFMREDLGDLPGDLLAEAISRVRKTHRFRSMPMPADIRGAVREELSRRRGDLMTAENMLRFGRFEREVSGDVVPLSARRGDTSTVAPA